MKAWLEKALRELQEDRAKSGPIGPFSSELWGEHQARIWFRTHSSVSGHDESRFIKTCIRFGFISTEHYCMECFDLGCTCGGIGLSCHGCCTCLSVNPNLYCNRKEPRKFCV